MGWCTHTHSAVSSGLPARSIDVSCRYLPLWLKDGPRRLHPVVWQFCSLQEQHALRVVRSSAQQATSCFAALLMSQRGHTSKELYRVARFAATPS
eukprot:6326044-Amphidinium_carterae.1